jgi:Domain of unknown function (DUF4124)
MTSGKTIFRCGLWLALMLAAPAFAGTVYRCESPDGSRTYGSKRVKGAKCSVISSYTPSPAAVRSAPVSATTARSASEAPVATPAAGDGV